MDSGEGAQAAVDKFNATVSCVYFYFIFDVCLFVLNGGSKVTNLLNNGYRLCNERKILVNY